jgi:hypothetical protein
MNACSHQRINPNDPPIEQAPYSRVIGPRRREMKPGTIYQCQRCGETLTVRQCPKALTNISPCLDMTVGSSEGRSGKLG